MFGPWDRKENQRLETGELYGLSQAVLCGALWRGDPGLRWPSVLKGLRLSGEKIAERTGRTLLDRHRLGR